MSAGSTAAKQSIDDLHHALEPTRGFHRLKWTAQQGGVSPQLADVESSEREKPE